ncbi:MAG: glycoside hydrolase family 43 protein [Christensenellales bacterium]|jgi:hypothetical protein
MNQAYLFVHFREKRTPDGEQVYFSLSRDGFAWEEVYGGRPVLESRMGDEGVRDCTIARTPGGFVIVATDLSLSRHMRTKYGGWKGVRERGSRSLMLWESPDLLHWAPQRAITPEDDGFGCLWAPDILRDPAEGDYLLHWSSAHSSNDYGPMKIWYNRTRDFRTFTKPAVLYEKADSGIIDSAMAEEDGIYYLFVKSEGNPETIIMLSSDSPTGPFARVTGFDPEMAKLEQGQYEAPAVVRLEDGRWCLFLDYYGTVHEKQGYVPFIANRLEGGHFVRADESFFFPYGFKHGTVLAITPEEYHSVKNYYQ